MTRRANGAGCSPRHAPPWMHRTACSSQPLAPRQSTSRRPPCAAQRETVLARSTRTPVPARSVPAGSRGTQAPAEDCRRSVLAACRIVSSRGRPRSSSTVSGRLTRDQRRPQSCRPGRAQRVARPLPRAWRKTRTQAPVFQTTAGAWPRPTAKRTARGSLRIRPPVRAIAQKRQRSALGGETLQRASRRSRDSTGRRSGCWGVRSRARLTGSRPCGFSGDSMQLACLKRASRSCVQLIASPRWCASRLCTSCWQRLQPLTLSAWNSASSLGAYLLASSTSETTARASG